MICFDGSIVSDTITHILNVVTYLTNTDFCSIQVIKGFVDLFNKVIDFVNGKFVTEDKLRGVEVRKDAKMSSIHGVLLTLIKILYSYFKETK